MSDVQIVRDDHHSRYIVKCGTATLYIRDGSDIDCIDNMIKDSHRAINNQESRIKALEAVRKQKIKDSMPPLPTAAGSVIRTAPEGNVFFLKDDGFWISQSGVRHGAYFSDRVTGFEILVDNTP